MNVSFQPAARADVLQQFEYLLREATPAIAVRFRAQIEIAANDAARRPEIGTPVFRSGEADAEVRSWPVPSFPAVRLYYIQAENGVLVLRVLHGKRNVVHIMRRARKTPPPE